MLSPRVLSAFASLRQWRLVAHDSFQHMLHALASSESVRLSISPLSPPQLSVVPVQSRQFRTPAHTPFSLYKQTVLGLPAGCSVSRGEPPLRCCLWFLLSSSLILLVLGSTFSSTGFRIVDDSSCQQRWSLSFAFLVYSDFIEENRKFLFCHLLLAMYSH